MGLKIKDKVGGDGKTAVSTIIPCFIDLKHSVLETIHTFSALNPWVCSGYCMQSFGLFMAIMSADYQDRDHSFISNDVLPIPNRTLTYSHSLVQKQKTH